MAFVLGVHGPAFAGKDTIADYLVEKKNWTSKLSFARNLKNMCKAIFELTEEEVIDQELKQKPFETPIKFNNSHFNAVLAWMSRTHANAHPVKGAFDKVKSLIGTELLTPRHVLQFVGTDICREIIPFYHVDIVLQQIKNCPEGKFVISDVRFPDEGNLIIDAFGGMVIEVTRPGLDGGVDRTHASETSMKGWERFTGTIENNKNGLDLLYQEVDNFLEKNNLCQVENPE